MKEKAVKYLVRSFNIEPAVWEKVKEIAEREDRKASDQLRLMVKEWLNGRK